MKNNPSVSCTSYKICLVPTNQFHTQKYAARILLLTGMPKSGQIDTGGTNGMGSRIGRGGKRKREKRLGGKVVIPLFLALATLCPQDIGSSWKILANQSIFRDEQPKKVHAICSKSVSGTVGCVKYIYLQGHIITTLNCSETCQVLENRGQSGSRRRDKKQMIRKSFSVVHQEKFLRKSCSAAELNSSGLSPILIAARWACLVGILLGWISALSRRSDWKVSNISPHSYVLCKAACERRKRCVTARLPDLFFLWIWTHPSERQWRPFRVSSGCSAYPLVESGWLL